jgi:hypothetical protein
MTTPQNQIYMLEQRVRDLIYMFRPEQDEEGNGEDIFDKVKQIELQQMDIMTSMQRLENQMALIIKLLSKQ